MNILDISVYNSAITNFEKVANTFTVLDIADTIGFYKPEDIIHIDPSINDTFEAIVKDDSKIYGAIHYDFKEGAKYDPEMLYKDLPAKEWAESISPDQIVPASL